MKTLHLGLKKGRAKQIILQYHLKVWQNNTRLKFKWQKKTTLFFPAQFPNIFATRSRGSDGSRQLLGLLHHEGHHFGLGHFEPWLFAEVHVLSHHWALQIELAAAVQIQLHLGDLSETNKQEWTSEWNPDLGLDSDYTDYTQHKRIYINIKLVVGCIVTHHPRTSGLPNVKQQRQKHIPLQLLMLSHAKPRPRLWRTISESMRHIWWIPHWMSSFGAVKGFLTWQRLPCL